MVRLEVLELDGHLWSQILNNRREEAAIAIVTEVNVANHNALVLIEVLDQALEADGAKKFAVKGSGSCIMTQFGSFAAISLARWDFPDPGQPTSTRIFTFIAPSRRHVAGGVFPTPR
jgi:hypothetical protein